MATRPRLLLILLLGLSSCAQLSAVDEEASLSRTDESCDTESPETSSGHSLLASRVVRNKIVDDALLPVDAGLQAVRAHIDAVEELRSAVIKQGSASPEQLQQLFGIAMDALNQKVKREGTPNYILLQANATEGAGPAAGASQPFKGDNDPLAARDRYDKDFIHNGDNDDAVFPGPTGGNETYEIPEGDAVEKKVILAIYIVAPLALVFVIVFSISNIMEKLEITAIPESMMFIIAGVILGLLLKRYAHFHFFEDVDAWGEMNSAILNLILLPIIIFTSGWALRRQDFYSQFPYILMFAMVGVAISTGVIACLIFWTGSMGLHGVTRWRTAFAYASLISATDPVATLSTYAKLKVDPLLNILVFGESIINDAVAIVLFNVFNSDHFMINSKGETMEGWAMILNLIWGTAKIFFGSTMIGVGLGILYTFISHWADMRHSKKAQILVIFASCYLTYAVAEGVGMSGIIAVMFAAIVEGVYMRSHLSSEGSMLATFFVKQLSMLADAAICLQIGVSVVQLTTGGLYFGLWVMLFCLIGRCASVFPVGISVNALKAAIGTANGQPESGWNLLSPQHMFMMWHAGLRGAIALALSLELGRWVDEIDGKGTRTALQTATFFLIVTFLLLFGGSTSHCLKHLRIPHGEDKPANHLSKTEDYGSARGFLKWVDRVILAPLLVGRGSYGEEDEQDVEERLKAFQRETQRWTR